MSKQLQRQMLREIRAINALLSAHGVNAGTKAKWTLVAGSAFIAYGVKLAPGETIAKIEQRLPELTERVSGLRGQRTPVRLRRTPLALEVPHPMPAALGWGGASFRLPAHHALMGRRYDYRGSSDVAVSLDDVPHFLIAGITGAGKSVALSMALLTLLFNTSPKDLRIVLVDLKNEDLVPFSHLPHVELFAGNAESAAEAIRYVHGMKDARVEAGRANHRYRLVLAIDELAELASITGALDQLGSVLSIGRSKRINVIAATQKPTAAVVGSIAKANFTARFVGRVADATEAATATGRKATGAEFLPGRGAFLRVQGPEVERIQSYFVSPADVDRLCSQIYDKWQFEPVSQKNAPTRLEMPFEPVRTGSKPVHEPPLNQSEPPVEPGSGSSVNQFEPPVFPLDEKRPLEAHEAAEVRRMFNQGMSKNAICREVYDAKSGRYMEWINEALGDDGKVLKLAKAVGG